MSLRTALEREEFVISCEVGPLKGTDTTEIIENAELLKGKVHAANVTDQQSAVMRLGSLATSYLIKEKGLEPIFQVTCRDRNRIALQSDLLSASALGIENVLALTGDFPTFGDHPQAKPVYDLDSVQLLWVIEQIMKLEKKIAAGAKFIQTQAIYDVDTFASFMKRIEGYKVPVLAGVIPLKSVGMARFMNKSVAGVFVPDHLIKRMTDAEKKAETGIQICAELIKGLRDICQGVHIMAIGWEKRVPQIIEAAGL
jgi:methylenetetrahydrofolate reductase (NADPH)